MKKFFTLLLFACLSLSSAMAIGGLKLGVEAGMNLNSLSFNKEVLNSENRMGFFVGPKAKINVPLLGFGLDAAVLYSMNTTNAQTVVAGETISGENKNLSYLQIPVNIRYDFTILSCGLYLATGPQYNWCMNSVSTMKEVRMNERNSWGWNIGAGIEILNKVQLGVTYTFPITTNKFPTGIGDIDLTSKSRVAAVRLGYYF